MARKLVTFAVVSLLGACSFPQVSYDTGEGGADASQGDGSHDGSASGGGDAGPDSGGDGFAGDDGQAASDAPSGDAPGDAVDDYVFEAAADAPVCDQDQDTYDAKGGTCGGLDCDDTDKHANPGVTTYQTYPAHPPSSGDWNCDGKVVMQFPESFNCGLLAGSACAGKSGFTDTPGCGQTSANFITCKVSTALLCVVDTTTSNTQGCL
ncbi:MAG: hypothetical protein ACRELB_02130 [Polyangiaceae bacterium]